MPAGSRADDETRFLNVDVDVWSKTDLQPLIAAFGTKVLVHYVGPEGRERAAHFSLASAHGKRADAIIRRLVALVEQLPTTARRRWDRARARHFNVGIQAGITPYSHETAFQPGTLEGVSRVRAQLVITIYAVVPRERR